MNILVVVMMRLYRNARVTAMYLSKVRRHVVNIDTRIEVEKSTNNNVLSLTKDPNILIQTNRININKQPQQSHADIPATILYLGLDKGFSLK